MKEETREKHNDVLKSPLGKYLMNRCRFKNKKTGRWNTGTIVGIGYKVFVIRFKKNYTDAGGKNRCISDTTRVRWTDIRALEWWG